MIFFSGILAIALIWSGLVWLSFVGAAFFFPSLKQWPAFWAVAILLAVCVPVMAGILALMPAISVPAMLPEIYQGADNMLEGFIAPFDGAALPSADIFSNTILLMIIALYGLVAFTRLVFLGTGMRKCGAIATSAKYIPHTMEMPAFWLTEAHTSPFALGGREPRIIISIAMQGSISQQQLRSILRHEQAHIDRRDPEMIILFHLIEAVCWFSPFIRRLVKRWQLAIEVQCDALAMQGQPQKIRQSYAKSLVQAMRISADRVQQYPAASFSTHHLRSEKMRIKKIMSGASPEHKRAWQKVMLCFASTIMAGTGAIAASAAAGTSDTFVAFYEAPVAKTGNIVEGRLTARYGLAFDPFKEGKKRQHHGVDIAAPDGTPIYAPADGVVVEATDLYKGKKAWGKVVVIDTGGSLQTVFAHLNSYQVKVGDKVRRGQLFALVGATGNVTGPHVHIETYRSGERVDPVTVWTTLDR